MARTKPIVYNGTTIYPPTKTKPNVWRVVWVDPSGDRKERTTTSEADARAIADSVEKMRSRGRSIVDAERTVAEVAERLLERISHLSVGYRQKAEGVLRLYILPTEREGKKWPGIGTLNMMQWSEASNERLLNACRALGLSPSYVQDIGSTMSALVTQAWKEHWLDRSADPMFQISYATKSTKDSDEAYIDRGTLPTTDNVHALLLAFETIREDRWRLASELIAGSGLRWGELIGLRPMDLRFDPRVIRVQRSIYEDKYSQFHVKAPKNGKSRETIFPASLTERLQHVCEMTEMVYGSDGLLFPGHNPEQFCARNYFARRWGNAGAAAGWPIVTPKEAKKGGKWPTVQWSPHDLRHYFACWALFDAHADVALVSKWLGHHSTDFTFKRYVNVRGDHAELAMDLFKDF